MSPGLKRAREPYRVRNAIMGMTLAALGVGIWAYSISAVKQDVFDDVDEEARALAASGSTSGMRSLVDDQKVSESPLVVAPVSDSRSADVQVDAHPPVSVGKGLLVKLLDRPSPWLLDPVQKTLVWGAPSVDNLDRISDTKGNRT